MTTKNPNLLILMSDEHSRKALGCYGNEQIETPNLDRLAARGTMFSNAYTPCPICVPARASFATGLYGHQTGHWDNATPYIGEPQSWGHELQRNGITVGSIGKLHYRNIEDDTGFDFQELPMHLVNGVGDVLGCVREPVPPRWKTRSMAEKIGPGETAYTAYDRKISSAAVDWIHERSNIESSDKPWTLFVSMVAPHFPLIAPTEFFELYNHAGIMPKKSAEIIEHPWLTGLKSSFLYDNFTDEKTRIALASYYALVSFMDANFGKVLDALDESDLTESTRVIYISDHGDNMGERGLWGKSTFYEESAGIPIIVAGPDIPEGQVSHTPVSLIDVYPTIMESMGIDTESDNFPGSSLIDIAKKADETERVVYSEYHAAGACSGAFMIRKGKWKMCYYVGLPPQLFDLESDPDELIDLGSTPEFASTLCNLETELRKICNPEEVDHKARQDQSAIVELHGGREAVVKRGGFGATPAPGETAEFIVDT